MEHAESSVHRPKVEVFDIAARTNTDPKGFVRPVEEYRVEPWGLYMARPSDHAKFNYLESWLLPTLGLRASIFHFLPEHDRNQNEYLDIGVFSAGEQRWTAVDHYLDIVIRTGREAELIDIDELLDARAAGLVSTAEATTAIETAVRTVEALARHDYNLEQWLATVGMPISWR